MQNWLIIYFFLLLRKYFKVIRNQIVLFRKLKCYCINNWQLRLLKKLKFGFHVFFLENLRQWLQLYLIIADDVSS